MQKFYKDIHGIIVGKIFRVLQNYQLTVEKENIKKIRFKTVGEDFRIGKDWSIKNPQNIEVGDSFRCLDRLRLDTFEEFMGTRYNPVLKIGHNANFNNDVHIACINKVIIGDNVLMASRIYISDHDHGSTTAQALEKPPFKRELFSKGPVIIEDNVWIGEGACILSGVTIGRSSIIGANSVVTKSIPPKSVAVGIPAKVIKSMF